MDTQVVTVIDECNRLLLGNTLYANGKNFRVEHLYETAASSRWAYENIWGIYLAKPDHAWMALWIAVTSRTSLKKRQIRYHAPVKNSGDNLGKIGIYNTAGLALEEILVDEAYLYLFDLPPSPLSIIDVSAHPKNEKLMALERHGFESRKIERRGRTYGALTYTGRDRALVDIDEWQVALVNTETLIPTHELVLTKPFLDQLSERIYWLSDEVGEDYISDLESM